MKKLMTVKEVADRYQCSEKTARRYMRRMDHMEHPLRVTEEAVEDWEAERLRIADVPVSTKKRGPVRRYPQGSDRFIISRVRPNYAGK